MRIATGIGCAALLALATACGDAHGPGDGNDHGGHEGHDHDDHPGEAGADRVRLAPEAAAAAGLDTARPGPARIEALLALPGEVAADPDRVAHLTPRSAGVVVEVRAALGARVAAGEVLAVLDSAERGTAKSEVLAARQGFLIARLDHERQEIVSRDTGRLLDLLAAGPSPEEARKRSADTVIGEDKARLLSTYAALHLARTRRDREEDLFARKIGSEADVLAARADMEEAEAAWAATRETVAYGHRARMAEAVRSLRVAEAHFDAARRRLLLLGVDAKEAEALETGGIEPISRVPLVAPLAGTVIEKHVVLGESLHTEASAFVIADLSSVIVRVAVPPADVGRASAGRRARVSVAGAGAPREGTVAYVSPVAVEGTRRVEAWIRLPNADGALRPGLFAEVAVIADEADVPLALPASAVLRVEGRESVFVKGTGGDFAVRAVRVGRRDPERVEILEGVAATDEVVVRNAFLLKAELAKGEAGHEH
jgi:cobalt-zinc-cadmium efflux system membrane fusion protein